MHACRSTLEDPTQGRPTPEAEAYYKHQRDVVGRMDAQVRKTWGVPADAGKERPTSAPKRKRPARPARRKPR